MNCSDRTYVGGFGSNGSIQTTQNTSSSHRGVVLGFWLLFMDLWEHETFIVKANGKTVYSIRHPNTESAGNYCGQSWEDSFMFVTFGFNHSDDSLDLVFTSDLSEDSSHAAWGICSLTIDLKDSEVDSEGNELKTIKPLSFRCYSPSLEEQWTYIPAYQTLKCGQKTYVGAYGLGDNIETELNIPSPHQGIIIRFHLVLFGNWKDEVFNFYINEIPVYQYSMSQNTNQMVTEHCDKSMTAIYEYVKTGLNYTGSSVWLKFNLTSSDSESEAGWGICDFYIQPSDNFVVQPGYEWGGFPSDTIFNCFSQLENVFWVYIPQYSTFKCNSYNYIGGFGPGGSLGAKLTLRFEHKGVAVHFYLALIDAWEDNAFKAYADGQLVYSLKHHYQDSGSNTCQYSWGDEYTIVKFGLNHTDDMIELFFTSDVETENASWGVCFLNVTSYREPVDSEGHVLLLAKDLTFACASPAFDPAWTFVPGFATTTCSNGNTYVGGFGKGGVVNTTVYTLGGHRGAVVSFKLALFDSWQDNTFYALADNETIYSKKYTYNKTAESTCGSEAYGDNYFDVRFGVNTSGAGLMLVFLSDLEEDAGTQSWGICDVSVVFTFNPVDAGGNEFHAVSFDTTFSCEAPAHSLDWIYTPSYQTVKCSDERVYVGGFGPNGGLKTALRVPYLHHGIIISFKLAFFESWNGEAIWIYADDNLVFAHNYVSSEEQSCQAPTWDSSVHVQFGFNHSAYMLNLEFTSDLDDSAEDASWGICDLDIHPVTYYVDLHGNRVD